MMALIAPVKLRSVASGFRIEKYALQPFYCPSLEPIDEFKGFIGETGWRGLYRGHFRRQDRPLLTGNVAQETENAGPLPDVRRIQCLVQ
jgi:hypothetical protein